MSVLQTSVRNVRRMLKLRGFRSFDNVCTNVDVKTYTMCEMKCLDSEDSLVVCAWMLGGCGLPEMKRYLGSHKNKMSHLVLITPKITPSALLLVQDRCTYVEILSLFDTKIVKDLHKWSPVYTIVTDDSVIADLKKKFGDWQMWPKILSPGDALARFYGFRPGQVVSESKYSPVVGWVTTHKLVMFANYGVC